MLTKFCAFGLVQDGKGDPSGKWPLKDAIIIALHHVNKQSNVSSNSTVHAIQVDTQAQLVTIEAGIEGWAVYGRRNAADGFLATLSVVFNPPDVRAIAHTAFEIKAFRFLTVEPNKRKKIFIRRPHGENFSFSFSCGLTHHSVFVQERLEITGVNSCIKTTHQISSEEFI